MHRDPTTRRSRRSAALAAVLAGGLLLGACSNAADPAPTAAPSATGSSAAAPTGGGPGSSVSERASADGATVADSSGGTGSSESSEPIDVATMSPTSIAPASRSAKPTPTAPKPSGSGAVSLGRDDVSWFGAMCTGLGKSPRGAVAKLTGDLAGKKKAVTALLTDEAGKLETAVATLSKLPAPAIKDGTALAKAVIAAFSEQARAARAGVRSVAGATDETGLTKAFGSTLDVMEKANSSLSNFSEMIGAPAVAAQLAKIPSCQPLLVG